MSVRRLGRSRSVPDPVPEQVPSIHRHDPAEASRRAEPLAGVADGDATRCREVAQMSGRPRRPPSRPPRCRAAGPRCSESLSGLSVGLCPAAVSGRDQRHGFLRLCQLQDQGWHPLGGALMVNRWPRLTHVRRGHYACGTARSFVAPARLQTVTWTTGRQRPRRPGGGAAVQTSTQMTAARAIAWRVTGDLWLAIRIGLLSRDARCAIMPQLQPPARSPIPASPDSVHFFTRGPARSSLPAARTLGVR